MAEKPADRTAEARTNLALTRAKLRQVNEMLAKPADRTAEARTPIDKMHVYVDGKHRLSTDAHKAHAVAETYMREGRSVWISRKTITL